MIVKTFLCVGMISLPIAGTMAEDEIETPSEIDIGCALAIHSALKHLENEPPDGKEDQPFHLYVRTEFGSIVCDRLDNEAYVELFPAEPTLGGSISYTIGLDDFVVRRREYGR